MAEIHAHASRDWCHICGRRTDLLVDVFYPDNAEHYRRRRRGTGSERYIRICALCAADIQRVALKLLERKL
jgi:hypothetical protein